MPEKIGRYLILRQLGQGGMGVVYVARDEDLGREVALKLIREDSKDEQAAKRFRREARAAARVNHPNVCQLFEIGEEGGALFIAMELLEGESLAERLQKGAIPLREAVPIALGMLSALTALHGRDIVHRDLKPSNTFLTPHGVKLLDFGLARPVKPDADSGETLSQVTQAGLIVGTPRYMAPEQLEAKPVDARTDLFAMGSILFEMLTARHPFRGDGTVEVLYAIAHEQPPALTGSPAIEAVDRVVRGALAKRPDERYPTAAAMAQDLREALALEDSGGSAQVHTLTRLIVLPFRALRPDPDTDFLAFSLPDAITAALSGLGSLVVRSSLAGAKYAAEGAPDLKRIASDADVDAVLTGTILSGGKPPDALSQPSSGGKQLRVATQLVEAPAGTLIWSHTVQATLTDIFQVQDDLVRRIVESLSAPLTAREHKQLKRQLPANARAYELYLRANQASHDPASWDVARDMYERCLEEDKDYAPAWARLGRVYRLLSKYAGPGADALLPKAESAFRRALEIDPDLPLTHNLFAQFEVEAGRPKEVMLRLLERTRRWSHDAELFAGLVHVLRYCGLLEASLAAHRRARGLDPNVRTSVVYTHWMAGNYESASELAADETFIRIITEGRPDEAVRLIDEAYERMPPHMRGFGVVYKTALRGERAFCLAAAKRFEGTPFRDSEGWYFIARVLAYAGERDEALRWLGRVVDGGFFCYPAFVRDPWLDSLRSDSAFREILRRADDRHRDAEVAFIQAGGDKLLA